MVVMETQEARFMFGIYSFTAGLLLFAVRVLIPHSIQLCLDSYYQKSATNGMQDDLRHLDKIPHRFSSQKHEKKKKEALIV